MSFDKHLTARGMTLVELMVSITIVAILIGLALPNLVKAKDKALEAEVKVNLRTINQALHQFYGDYEGQYPSYIWGGNMQSWGYPGEGATAVRAPYADFMALDPLIRRGYLTTYPRNPFIKDGRGLCQVAYHDPRFACHNDNMAELQTEGTVMGNVLQDPNHPSSGFHDLDLSQVGGAPVMQTPGNYFVGDGDPKSQDFVPGQFMYRSYNTRARQPWASQIVGGTITESRELSDAYVLAAWGSIRTVGGDHLCSPMFQNNDCLPDPGGGSDDYGYGGPGIYADGLPNIVFRDFWDTDNDGNLNNDDCDGNGITGEPNDCDADEIPARSMRDKVGVAPMRAGKSNPDDNFDGLIFIISSQGAED